MLGFESLWPNLDMPLDSQIRVDFMKPPGGGGGAPSDYRYACQNCEKCLYLHRSSLSCPRSKCCVIAKPKQNCSANKQKSLSFIMSRNDTAV